MYQLQLITSQRSENLLKFFCFEDRKEVSPPHKITGQLAN